MTISKRILGEGVSSGADVEVSTTGDAVGAGVGVPFALNGGRSRVAATPKYIPVTATTKALAAIMTCTRLL